MNHRHQHTDSPGAAGPRAEARIPASLAGRAGLLLFALAALVPLFAGQGRDWRHTFAVVFVSIVLEAVPFMLLGALVGGLIEVFVSRDRLTALLPRRRWLAVFASAAMGLVFPVCECAVVPVVRRLARKGLPPAAAIAYLLAGPIVNPIVAASTALAYGFDWRIVAARLGCGYLIAVGVALLVARLVGDRRILLPEVATADDADSATADRADYDAHDPDDAPAGEAAPCRGHSHSQTHGEDDGHEHEDEDENGHGHGHGPEQEDEQEHGHGQGRQAACCACGHDHGPAAGGLFTRLGAACRHAMDDFLAVGHFLVIGAFVAALAQTFVERRVFAELSQTPATAIGLMMLLAVLLNLCSEADAFIAASFRGLVPLPAQLAFMLTGPMLDLKLLLMYTGLFRRRAIVVLALLILAAVFAVALAVQWLGGLAS